MNAFGRRVGLTVAGRRVLMALAVYAVAALMLSWSKSRPATASSLDRPASTQATTQVIVGAPSDKN